MSARERLVALTVAAGLIFPACAASSATPSQESEAAVAVLSPEARQARAVLMDTLSARAPHDVQKELVTTGSITRLENACVGWHIEEGKYAVTVAPAVYTVQTHEGVFTSFTSMHAPVRRQSIDDPTLMLPGPFSYKITAKNAPGYGLTYKPFPFEMISLDLQRREARDEPTLTRVDLTQGPQGSFLLDQNGSLVMATKIFNNDQITGLRAMCDEVLALTPAA